MEVDLTERLQRALKKDENFRKLFEKLMAAVKEEEAKNPNSRLFNAAISGDLEELKRLMGTLTQ